MNNWRFESKLASSVDDDVGATAQKWRSRRSRRASPSVTAAFQRKTSGDGHVSVAHPQSAVTSLSLSLSPPPPPPLPPYPPSNSVYVAELQRNPPISASVSRATRIVASTVFFSFIPQLIEKNK